MIEKTIKYIHAINTKIGHFAAWFTLLLVVLVVFNVGHRYLFSENLNWLKELEWHFFGIIFLFGAAYTLMKDKHVRVDLFYERYSKREKAQLNFWGCLIFLIPWCILVIITSFNYALESFLIREKSPELGGLGAWYIIKFLVPIGIFLLLLQAIALLLESYQTLRQDKTAETE